MNNFPCPLHKGFEDKLDIVIGHQLDYMSKQSDISTDIQYIKDTVDNGLKSKVGETAEQVQALHDQIAILEDFAWFREWVTDLRNNFFKNLCKWAILGGLCALAYIVLMAAGYKHVPKLLTLLGL